MEWEVLLIGNKFLMYPLSDDSSQKVINPSEKTTFVNSKKLRTIIGFNSSPLDSDTEDL